jgi:hypothetical protein
MMDAAHGVHGDDLTKNTCVGSWMARRAEAALSSEGRAEHLAYSRNHACPTLTSAVGWK